ncbi:Subunit of the glycosylphosphatidylinositol transamidase complex-like protein [Steccherinum ochraceum]|uniref:Subunit of the glycosylphosphatidylinositol transamidase complex-like protein n=1 Tax=Steccherinum ochraceum TaxID=92696 RepID=A0A4R0RPX1_9APHY|nr:Subunit of the glycosylphosphatidylinositol transamidase complex-like protein [Steccherinum ochraceum]
MLGGRYLKIGLILNLCTTLTLGHILNEDFHETLDLRPLPDGRLLSAFSFTTLLKEAIPRDPETLGSEDETQHYTLFPLALGQVLREYAVTELHMSLNAGKWDYDRWGYPEDPGVGTGAELWAYMGDSSAVSVDARWRGLRNALAGLFCASLGSLDDQRTTSPSLTFRPEGSFPQWTSASNHQLRHATLPSENVCTENLTPFLKLLPCKGLSGIASLLNPHRLFDSDWHGLSVHVRYLRDHGVEVRLNFQAVSDPVRYSVHGKRDWSLSSVFDRTIHSSCRVASSSMIRVARPTEKTAVVSPEPPSKSEDYAIFDLSDTATPLDISMQWQDESKFIYPLASSSSPLTPISVQRTLKGSIQSQGRLSVVITNHLPITIQTSYLETMPWLLQFYLHSLRTYHNGISRDDLVSIVSYTPPVPHLRPTLFQAVLTLPPKGTLHLSMDVMKPFLRYTEHPPDAERGWNLPPAVFVPLISNTTSSSKVASELNVADVDFRRLSRRIYTPVLLVDLATPDFSMPYNVIIMSCTLIALIFGSVFNLLTRKFVVVRVNQDSKPATRSPVPELKN